MEYRDAIIHYNPEVDSREIDRHFPAIFGYAVTKGEALPEITEHPFPDPSDDDGEEYSSARTMPPRID